MEFYAELVTKNVLCSIANTVASENHDLELKDRRNYHNNIMTMKAGAAINDYAIATVTELCNWLFAAEKAKPSDDELMCYEMFADNIVSCAVKSIQHDNYRRLTAERYASKLCKELLAEALSELQMVTCRNKERMCSRRHIETLSQDLMTKVVNSITNLLDAGLLWYCDDLALQICQSAMRSAVSQLINQHEITSYSHRLSQALVGMHLTEIMSNDNGWKSRKSYMEGCAESIVQNSIGTALSEANLGKIAEQYAENIVAGLLSTSIKRVAGCCHGDVKNANRKQNKPLITLHAAEKYANYILCNMHLNIAERRSIDGNESASDSLNIPSSPNYHRLWTQSESTDDFGEVETPRSVCDDNWKRGLYHFADQLLYSLSALEDENEDQHVDMLVHHYNTSLGRTRRSGSCPHILCTKRFFRRASLQPTLSHTSSSEVRSLSPTHGFLSSSKIVSPSPSSGSSSRQWQQNCAQAQRYVESFASTLANNIVAEFSSH